MDDIQVPTSHLFLPLHHELMDVLRGLEGDDWLRSTPAPGWRVRDVAAHILDGDLRKLAVVRDGHAPPPEGAIDGYDALVAFLDRLNATWLRAVERLSPRLLVELLETTGPAVAELVRSLDPDAPATFPVAWAGQEASPNWMDVGRDYTERWHHQQQIRAALGLPELLGAPWIGPLMELSVRALPRAYADTPAPDGTAVVLDVEEAGRWTLVRDGAGWRLDPGDASDPACRVATDAATGWRIFFNALPPDAARERLVIEGEDALAEPLLRARAVMV